MKGYEELKDKMSERKMSQQEFENEVKKVQALNLYQSPETIWQLLHEDGMI